MPVTLDVEDLRHACALTQDILENVSREQLSGRTPCADWTVRDLVQHIVAATDFFGDVAELGSSPDDRDWPDYPDGDFATSFRELSGRVASAFAAEGAMDKTMTLPNGQHPGSQCIQVAVGELFVHGWDLARSTGQLPPDDTVAEALLSSDWIGMCRDVREAHPSVFAPELPLEKGANSTDRLVGFLGRDPRWQPSSI